MNVVRYFSKLTTQFPNKYPFNSNIMYKFGEGNLSIKRQKEAALASKLRQNLNPTYLEVIDTSIGSNTCIFIFDSGGQMYRILIESPVF